MAAPGEAVSRARHEVDLVLVERERLDTQIVGGSGHLFDRFHAGSVPVHPFTAARFGPAAVAIHDDGHMARDAVGVQLVGSIHRSPRG